MCVRACTFMGVRACVRARARATWVFCTGKPYKCTDCDFTVSVISYTLCHYYRKLLISRWWQFCSKRSLIFRNRNSHFPRRTIKPNQNKQRQLHENSKYLRKCERFLLLENNNYVAADRSRHQRICVLAYFDCFVGNQPGFLKIVFLFFFFLSPLLCFTF